MRHARGAAAGKLPDVVEPEVRSRMMAGIRGKNTRPELIVRRMLHAAGFRYRLHDRSLPGKPDLVFARRKAVIFVNGCFWHGHDCHLFRWPGTRTEFWREKISTNIRRDRHTRDQLAALGWRVGEIWECSLKGRERRTLQDVLAACVTFLEGSAARMSIGVDQTVTISDAE